MCMRLRLFNYTGNNDTYTYDGLNRLTGSDRATGTGNDQSWSLDALGNMTSVNTGGSTDTRTTNDLNELTHALGADIAYDNNGNMLNDADGNTFTYDAWNRLVAVYDSGANFVVGFVYDGLGRRVQEITPSGGVTASNDLYYSASWQILEEGGKGTGFIKSPFTHRNRR